MKTGTSYSSLMRNITDVGNFRDYFPIKTMWSSISGSLCPLGLITFLLKSGCKVRKISLRRFARRWWARLSLRCDV